ncbi:MAG: HigA family addiction module antidote protein [Thermoanaerobaculia bacterium]|nr:HigA family addiction module antidote protein [Thermoanaerobaculia bacterium]
MGGHAKLLLEGFSSSSRRPNGEHNRAPRSQPARALSQTAGHQPSQLAESIRVPAQQVSELIAGRQSMTPDMAARLALFFEVPAEWWLRQQASYDAAHLAPVEELRGVVRPYQGLTDVLVTPHGVRLLAPPTSVPAPPPKATFSKSFLARLRAQVEGMENPPRTVIETTFADGTVALVGK